VKKADSRQFTGDSEEDSGLAVMAKSESEEGL